MAAKRRGAGDEEIDELTRAELDDRLTRTMHHIDEIRRLWPGMVRLPEIERRSSMGRMLNDLARHFGDDVLNTGEMVIGPGLLALELARSVSKTNPDYRALLAPALDAFRDMTKNARRRLAEQHADKAPEK